MNKFNIGDPVIIAISFNSGIVENLTGRVTGYYKSGLIYAYYIRHDHSGKIEVEFEFTIKLDNQAKRDDILNKLLKN